MKLENVRSEIVRLLVDTTLLTTVFATLVALHYTTTRFFDLLGQDGFTPIVFQFLEYALFGATAFLALVVCTRAIWRIIRALLLDLDSRSQH